MKQNKCYICGNNIDLEKNQTCPFCLTSLDKDIILKTDKVKTLKHNMMIYFINKEYSKIIVFLDNNYNSLLLEYFKSYSYIQLNKPYTTKLYNDDLLYTEDELDYIINNILENTNIFNNTDILKLISKSKNKDYYLNILNNPTIYSKHKETILRIKLFPLTTIPETKQYDSTKQEGIALIILSGIAYILIALLIIIFTSKDMQYYMFNILYIIPSICLTCGIIKIIPLKQLFKNKYLSSLIIILLFIFILYLSTLPSFLIYNDVKITFIFDHFMGIITTPIEIIKQLPNESESLNVL